MLSVDEALARVMATLRLSGEEVVSLDHALGRVLAHNLDSPVDVPPWRSSAMDGYAVQAADTSDDGVQLRLNEVVGAGGWPSVALSPGTATAVMTGAPLPEGADAVVVIEDSDGSMEGEVGLRLATSPGRYVRARGSDVVAGSRVIDAGTTLSPADVGLLGSLGMPEVAVRVAPRVAILTTGDELVRPGSPLAPGQICSTNHLTLAGLVRQAGGDPVDHGNVGDDLDSLLAALEPCLEADLVLTTGGVSVGIYDHMKEALAELGVRSDFWKVRMKPGKPLAFGVSAQGSVVFGLPGNPVSCMVNFLQFVRPWIRSSLGDPTPFLPVVNAVAAETIQGRPGRARLERVILAYTPEGFEVRSTGNQSSGVLTSMSRAHGLLIIPADERGPEPGDRVRVQLLDPSFLDGSQPGYGW